MPDPVIGRLRILTAPVTRLMFARYLLASVCALGIDMAIFLTLEGMGVPPLVAAFCGYGAGLLMHWTVSIRFVFDTADGPTHAQRAGFVASALLGMGMTLAMVGGLSAMGFVPAIAKLASVPISFVTVYAIRKYGVFARA